MTTQEKCMICNKKEWTEPSVFNWGKNGEKYICENCRWTRAIIGIISLSIIVDEINKQGVKQDGFNKRCKWIR